MPVGIDLELDGTEDLLIEFDELEENGTTDAAFSVGSNAENAVPLEFGRGPIEAPEGSAIPIQTESGETIFRKRVSGHPPYPWFRPAIREARLDLVMLMRRQIQRTPDEAQTARQLLWWISQALSNQMTDNVSAESATGRSPGTHPSHPKRDTGNLAADIGVEKIR